MDSDWGQAGGGGGGRGRGGAMGPGGPSDRLAGQGSFRGRDGMDARSMAERAMRGGGMGPGMDGPGPRGGPGGPGGPGGGARGGGVAAGVEADRWARGAPLPPARGGGGPPGMRGGAVPGLPALHKTDSAFKAGMKLTDDPVEEEKQRKFKVRWRGAPTLACARLCVCVPLKLGWAWAASRWLVCVSLCCARAGPTPAHAPRGVKPAAPPLTPPPPTHTHATARRARTRSPS
jgi:hypothetical protein